MILFQISNIMAAPLKSTTFSKLRCYHRLLCNGVARYKSTSTPDHNSSPTEEDRHSEPLVSLSSDGNTVICWHPEPEFPYEHTQPMPRNEVNLKFADSALKVQHLRDDYLRYREDGPTDEELANLFHTSKHQWYPNRGIKYRKPFPPKDRDSI